MQQQLNWFYSVTILSNAKILIYLHSPHGLYSKKVKQNLTAHLFPATVSIVQCNAHARPGTKSQHQRKSKESILIVYSSVNIVICGYKINHMQEKDRFR